MTNIINTRNHNPIPFDIIIVYIIPYTSYYQLDKLFASLSLPYELRKKLKNIEYEKRLTWTTILGPDYRNIFMRYRIEQWTIEGKLHRENDEPARLYDGTSEWYWNGKLHRENKPAFRLYGYGPNCKYYKHGKLHCENGPAVHNTLFVPKHRVEWWLNGIRHRAGGLPAVYYINEYYPNKYRTEYDTRYLQYFEWWENGLKDLTKKDICLTSGEWPKKRVDYLAETKKLTSDLNKKLIKRCENKQKNKRNVKINYKHQHNRCIKREN